MTVICQSYAKINLHLQVLGLRDDGYHELETIFQTIDLADEIALQRTDPGVRLQVVEGDAPSGERNLAYRAATEYLKRWAPDQGVHISLKKRIPVGGGLGGGSSNAATVLRALRTMVQADVDLDELEELAADLGADVPFFLSGGTAVGVGRGDLISSFQIYQIVKFFWLFRRSVCPLPGCSRVLMHLRPPSDTIDCFAEFLGASTGA